LYHDYRIKSLKVMYKKETLLGDDLEIKIFSKEGKIGDNIETFTVVEKDGQIATEIYAVWTKGGIGPCQQ